VLWAALMDFLARASTFMLIRSLVNNLATS
jgi:hypothetical protein